MQTNNLTEGEIVTEILIGFHKMTRKAGLFNTMVLNALYRDELYIDIPELEDIIGYFPEDAAEYNLKAGNRTGIMVKKLYEALGGEAHRI